MNFTQAQKDYFVIALALAAMGVFWIYLQSKKPDIELSKKVTQREVDSLARLVIVRDSLSAIKFNKENEAAVKAQEEEDRKFYATKAGRIYKKHPEWSKSACERLANNEVWIGMHLEMLHYLRGLPDAANESNYGNGSQWQWCWYELSPSCFYDRDNDLIVDAYN